MSALQQHSLSAQKARLRKLVLARRRAAFDAAGGVAGEALARHGLALAQTLPPGSIGAYWPTRGEPDVRPLMTALAGTGRQIALPVMAGRTDPLTFHAWAPGDDLIEGPFKILEPAKSMPVMSPVALFVPLWRSMPRGTGLATEAATMTARSKSANGAPGAAALPPTAWFFPNKRLSVSRAKRTIDASTVF